MKSMKTLLVLVLNLVVCLTAANSQVTIVQHKGYKAWFDSEKHEPVYVKWTLTPAMLSGPHFPRTNEFKADPLLPGTNFNKDYDGAGYDKGHQQPAEDASGDKQTEEECFYFSNMEPQTPNLNRVTWKGLEMWCRKEVINKGVTLTVICGGLQFDKTIGPDKVAVPAYCWKAVEENGIWTAWLFPNTSDVTSKPFTAYAIGVKDLDTKLGFKVEDIQ